jgi:ribosomal protein L11 methyltransferase
VRWVEFRVQVHPEAVDAVANVFQELGTGGVAIEQPLAAYIEGEEPLRFTDLPAIKAYLPITADLPAMERRLEEALWHLQAFDLSPVGPLERREIEEEDWANGWKEHFHPLRIGNVVIKPSWREWDTAPGEIVLELDPGMAFGTGLHPTTALMLRAVQEHVQPGAAVLDLGTGSGILALAAARLGARVTALDVSEVAVEAATRNVDENGLGGQIKVAHGSIDAVAGQTYDLLLANIIARVIADLAPALRDALRPGGILLASGIIEERADLVREALAAAGLHLIDDTCDGDWRLMVARRPA